MLVVKVCEWCNVEFEVESWKNQKYCSKKCGSFGTGKKRSEVRRVKVDKFIEENTGKHFCSCGCGKYIVVTEDNYPNSIPKFINHHYATTDAAKDIISYHHTGKDVSEETRDKMGLAHKGNDYRKGHKNTSDHNEKIAKALTGNTNAVGVIFTDKQRKNVSDGLKKFRADNPGIWCGIDARNWKGGVSYEPYCSKFNNGLKQQVRDKYNNCDFMSGLPDYICNIMKSGKVQKLAVHHVDYNKMQGCDGSRWLLIPVSRSNNSMFNRNCDFWEKLICYALEYDKTYYDTSDIELIGFNEVFNV